ncbi:MAG TPA: hypothetical protein VH301_03950 [Usitatibacter sp.]|jgi:hypothetical protein|nr:hypothetical protein [Usitatibacter sp.]
MRRRTALALLAAGASGVIARALAKGDIPPGVNQLDGIVHVNGAQAHVGTPVRPGDRVATGHASSAVIVVGKDAFLLRSQTVIELGKGPDGLLAQLAVASGGVLSVFSKKPVTIKASTASIGIRGTGAYVEMDTAGVYFCLCYGEALVEGPGMASGRLVRTTHHEEPLLLRDNGSSMRIEAGPFRNHTDAELVMLEALVGREPPFMKGGSYPANKY